MAEAHASVVHRIRDLLKHQSRFMVGDRRSLERLRTSSLTMLEAAMGLMALCCRSEACLARLIARGNRLWRALAACSQVDSPELLKAVLLLVCSIERSRSRVEREAEGPASGVEAGDSGPNSAASDPGSWSSVALRESCADRNRSLAAELAVSVLKAHGSSAQAGPVSDALLAIASQVRGPCAAPFPAGSAIKSRVHARSLLAVADPARHRG